MIAWSFAVRSFEDAFQYCNGVGTDTTHGCGLAIRRPADDGQNPRRLQLIWLKPLSFFDLLLSTTFIESVHRLTIPSIQPPLRPMLADTPPPHGSGASQ